MKDSSIVEPSTHDQVAPLEVSPIDVVSTALVQASHGFELGVTQGFWLWVVSSTAGKRKIPGFFTEVLLLVLGYGRDTSPVITFK